MTTTGYGNSSTASEVLAGLDVAGRTAVVTGGYSGIGLETSRALTAAGVHVIVPARRPEVAAEALANLPGLTIDELDLGDLDSVRAFADRLLAQGSPVDMVIAGAGVMACPETRVGPGWEAQLATNHLGHYALVNLLWPALAVRGARVVSVASGYDPSSHLRWDDLHFTTGYDKWAAYGQSKLANVLFARHLDLVGRAHGVRALSANPGYILTPLQRHLPKSEMVDAGWIDAEGRPAPGVFKTPAQGAATQVWAATSPVPEGAAGGYCVDCAPSGLPIDDAEAARLWALSAGLTGMDALAMT